MRRGQRSVSGGGQGDVILGLYSMVGRFFRDITVERLRRGVFTSVPELIQAIEQSAAPYTINPKPFLRTGSVHDILHKVIRVAAE